MNTTKKTKEEYILTLLISMFKSMGESVTLSVNPDYSEEGEILESGFVNIEGRRGVLFGRYGNIPERFEEYTVLIQEAEAMLPDFEDMSSEEKISTIEEIFAWLRGEDEEEEEDDEEEDEE